MIDIKSLKMSDIGRRIVYRNERLNTTRNGIITTWSAFFIFVRYENDKDDSASYPNTLEWENDR